MKTNNRNGLMLVYFITQTVDKRLSSALLYDRLITLDPLLRSGQSLEEPAIASEPAPHCSFLGHVISYFACTACWVLELAA